jgi:hypothetical protein
MKLLAPQVKLSVLGKNIVMFKYFPSSLVFIFFLANDIFRLTYTRIEIKSIFLVLLILQQKTKDYL